MPLYVATNVAIKPNWQSLIELANDFKNDNLEKIRKSYRRKLQKNISTKHIES
jgi:hypothetical protein